MHIGNAGAISMKEVIIILDVFAESLKDGLDIKYALRRLESIFARNKKAQVIEDIRNRILNGGSIANGFKGILPGNFVEAIESGEKCGNIDTVFAEIKAAYELKQNTYTRIRKAMAYPLVSILLLFGLFIGALLIYVPQLETIFKEIPRNKIPDATKMLVFLSHSLRHNFIFFSAVLGGVVILLTHLVKRYYHILFKIPLVKSIMELQENATTYLLFAVFYESGISVKRIFEMLEPTLQGPLRAIFSKAITEMAAGASLSGTFEKSGASEDVVVYLEVGELTQRVEHAFKRLSDIEAARLQQRLNILTETIKNLLIIVAGALIVVFFAITVLPVYDMTR